MGMQRTYSPGFSQQQPMEQDSKGKSRMVELDDKDWEEQFASLDQVDQDALDAEANAAMEAELNGIDRSVDPSATETDHYGDFESIWRGIQAEQADRRQMMDESEQLHLGDDMEPVSYTHLTLPRRG